MLIAGNFVSLHLMNTRKYKHLIFDLDRTLWDFDSNSHLALEEMYQDFKLESRGIGDFENFYKEYKVINAGLWDDYRNGKVDRPTLSLNRFLHTLRLWKVDDAALAGEMSQYYVKAVAEKTILFPGVHLCLDRLKPLYQLHVLTNGFADVQYRKLDRSGLRPYFTFIITSEEAGAHKPSPLIFDYTLKKLEARPSECLMIGDDPEVDLLSARAAGMDQMLVNHDDLKHDHQFTYEVTELQKIAELLS